jgi:polyphosphate kinase
VRNTLELYLTDNSSALLLQPDGQYAAPSTGAGQAIRNVQGELLEKLCGPAGNR